jgi:hypothetical protein
MCRAHTKSRRRRPGRPSGRRWHSHHRHAGNFGRTGTFPLASAALAGVHAVGSMASFPRTSPAPGWRSPSRMSADSRHASRAPGTSPVDAYASPSSASAIARSYLAFRQNARAELRSPGCSCFGGTVVGRPVASLPPPAPPAPPALAAPPAPAAPGGPAAPPPPVPAPPARPARYRATISAPALSGSPSARTSARTELGYGRRVRPRSRSAMARTDTPDRSARSS